MYNKLAHGTPLSATKVSNSGTAVATATIQGVTGSVFFVTDVSGSSDRGTAVLLIQAVTATSSGTTVIIWQDRIGNSGAYEHQFLSPLATAPNGSVSVSVDGQLLANANIAGFMLP